MDWSLAGSSVLGDSPGKKTEVGGHALLQGIFPAQGSNPGLPHYRRILYLLSHQGSICVFLHIEYYMWLTWNSAVSDRIGNVPALSSLLRAMIIPIIYCTLTTNKALCWEFTCSVSILTTGLLGRDYFFIFYKLIKGALRYWAFIQVIMQISRQAGWEFFIKFCLDNKSNNCFCTNIAIL